jgi:phosphoglucosamine mutase
VGVDAVDLGVIPTPGVAALSAAYGIPGAMISASHNPFYDNGVKVFAAGGRKLSDEVERRLEEALEEALGAAAGATGTTDDDDCAVGDRIGTQLHNGPAAPSRRPHSAGGAGVGTLKSDTDGLAWYRRQVLAALEGRRLDGMRVVLDCGHGAAVVTAPDVAAGAGAEVVEVLGAAPDGVNINAGCGSTAPGPLAAAVVARGADVGLAFDGDADRVIAVDGTGAVVDGDRLLALFATDLAARGALAGGTVAVTVMTNLGFHRAMAGAGIAVHQTDVGDRNVLSALDDGGWSLGGEQSGHLIFRDLATTGDGVLSGLLLLDLVRRAGRPLAELAAEAMERFPQVLLNVAVADPSRLAGMTEVWEEVHAVERHLGERGRVLLRPSGTEPLVRVMVEASTDAEAGAAVARIAGAVQAALGRPAA